MKIKKAHGKYCLAQVKLDSESMQKLSSLPGFKKWIGRDLLFDPTGANIDRIKMWWPKAEWSECAQPILDKYIEGLKQAEETRKAKTEDQIKDLEMQLKDKKREADKVSQSRSFNFNS